jgi:hypothetical protein
MASTYTTNLGIEKIASGEQSNTWGDTTNANFDIIDQAISGLVTVTLTSAGDTASPNALNITDGSLSDGRNKQIIFNDGGDLGGTVYVQLAPNDAEKVTYIRNSLSASRDIELFQGTYNSSNKITIPNGKDMLVRFGGTGTSSLVSEVLADEYRTGDLTVDNLTVSTDVTVSNDATITGTATIGSGRTLTESGTTLVSNSTVRVDSASGNPVYELYEGGTSVGYMRYNVTDNRVEITNTESDATYPATLYIDDTNNLQFSPAASASVYKVWNEGNDGSGSSLDADLLDGQEGSYYRDAGNLNAGTIPSGRLTGTYAISISGNAATATSATSATSATTATNATQLNSQTASYYTNASNLNAGTVASARLSGTYAISISGNAATASSATSATSATSAGTVTITSTGSNANYYIPFMSGTSGNQTLRGDTGIYFNPSTNALTCAGNITAYSDARLKENVETITNALEIVSDLRGVFYDKDGKPGIGVIAQEVEEVLPEVVSKDGEYLSVAYGNIVGVLIEAIKELQQKVEDLEQERGM